MKRVLSFLLAFVLVFALCITGTSAALADSPSTAEKPHYKFAVSYMTLNNPFWVQENKTLKSAIEANGDELAVYDGQNDQFKQISQIEDAIQSGVDLIFISPYDFKGIKPALEACERAGIPVVNIDTAVYDQDLVECAVIADNILGGQMAANALVEAIGGAGDIAIIDLSVNMACQDRVKGFLEVIEQYPDINVVAQQDGDGSLATGLNVMENILQANPDLKGVFGINDPTSLGACAALESAGLLDEVAVVSVDGSSDAFNMVKEGKMTGTALQFPSLIAQTCANLAYDILEGKGVEEHTVVVPMRWVNVDNAEELERDFGY